MTDIASNRKCITFDNELIFMFLSILGMGKELLHYPNVQEMYEAASHILGYNLLELCLNGPSQKLNKTIHQQPAVVVASLAAIEK